MAAKLTPTFGLIGKWKLRSPFVAKPARTYTCAAIRSFGELSMMGLDVFKSYYEPHGLSESNYQSDLPQNPAIVTLISDEGERIFVPDTYIESLPDMNIGDYKRFVLSCDLGTLPARTGLEHIRKAAEAAIEPLLGRKPNALITLGPIKPDELTETEKTREEANRKANVKKQQTQHGQLYELNKRISDLEGYCRILRQKVTDSDRAQHELTSLKERFQTVNTEYEKLKTKERDLRTEHTKLSERHIKNEDLIKKLREQVVGLGGKPAG